MFILLEWGLAYSPLEKGGSPPPSTPSIKYKCRTALSSFCLVNLTFEYEFLSIFN